MSNYLYAELENNSFKVVADGSVLGYNFKGASFKIDTGCSNSTIPIKRLFHLSDIELLNLKAEDIKNTNIDFMESYGIETGGTPHVKAETFNEKLSSSAIKFKHKVYNLVLSDYTINDMDMFINYNRSGNILLGMDFLSRFDIHIGYSYKVHKVVFIGVLKEQSDKSDYNKALAEHFGLVPKHSIFASLFRNRFRSQD